MCYYYNYGSAGVASELRELTNEIRYQRLKKEGKEFGHQGSKKVIFENNLKHGYSNFGRIIYSKGFNLGCFGNRLTSLFILSLLVVTILTGVRWSFTYTAKIVFPMIFIFYILRSMVFLGYWHFAGLREFTQLSSSNGKGPEGLVFKECKSTIEKVGIYCGKRPYPWVPENFVFQEIFNRLYCIVAISCDPDGLFDLPNIKITRLLNNLNKNKGDLGGRIALTQDLVTIENPINLCKFNFVQGALLCDSQSHFTYSFSDKDIQIMKEEYRLLEEKSKNKNQF